jgi:hypothetical protein
MIGPNGSDHKPMSAQAFQQFAERPSCRVGREILTDTRLSPLVLHMRRSLGHLARIRTIALLLHFDWLGRHCFDGGVPVRWRQSDLGGNRGEEARPGLGVADPPKVWELAVRAWVESRGFSFVLHRLPSLEAILCLPCSIREHSFSSFLILKSQRGFRVFQSSRDQYDTT